MTATFVRAHTAGTSKTSNTTVTATLAALVASGNLLVISIGMDNLGTFTPTVSSVSKPGGETNSWAKLASHSASSLTAAAAVVGELWAIRTTQSWASATVVTVTISSAVTAKATTLLEFSGVTATLRTVGGGGSSTAGIPAANMPTGSQQTGTVGDLVVGFGTFEQAAAVTGDADTTNGSWSTATTSFTTGGGTATNVSAITQYKVLTASGLQIYEPTGTSTDSGCNAVALVPSGPAPSLAFSSRPIRSNVNLRR